MYLFRSVGVQKFNGFPHLSSSYDAVIHKQQLFALYKLMNRYKLHFCHLVSHGLILRHKASGPSGCIFYKRSCEGNPASIGVAYGMRHSGVRHSADVVHIGQSTVFYVRFRHYLTVAGSHCFYGYSLVYRIWITVICP